MPPPDGQTLRDGARELDVALDDAQVHRLLDYVALLEKWNRVYNLTAVRDPAQMLVQHLLDSMAVIAPLSRWAGDRAATVLDVGSGAGLPGIVIATSRPEFEVTCIDAVGKKASFITQVAGALGLRNLHAVHARVEQWAGGPFDMIISRAFASLADFVTLTRRQAHARTVWLAMKGLRPDSEIAVLPEDIDLFHVEQLAVPGLAAERCLLWMRLRG